MKNQQGLKLFFILFCSTAFLVAFAQVGAFAFTSIAGESFSDGIQISNVDLSGKSISEAVPLVKEAIKSWEKAQTIKIHYKGNEQLLSSDTFQFFVEESLQASVPGQIILKVAVNREKLLESIDEVAPSGVQFDIEQISNEIISYASVLSEEPAALDLQNYEISSSKEKTRIAVSKVKLPTETAGIAELLDALGDITLTPVSQFSMNKFLEQKEQLQANPVYLNMVASGIYEVFLKSDFEVIERHISSDVPVKERIGYDINISQGNNLDLVVFNPNDQEYNLELTIENGILVVRLFGVPLSAKFEVTVETEEFKPKTIKRYNPLLKPDEIKVEQEGKNGLLAIVTRQSFDEKGGLLNTELISEDFYSPVHKIEISGLKPLTTNTVPDASSPGTIILPGQESPDDRSGTSQQGSVTTPPSSEGGAVGLPANPGTDGEGEKETDKDDQKDSGNDKDGIWGKPNEDEK